MAHQPFSSSTPRPRRLWMLILTHKRPHAPSSTCATLCNLFADENRRDPMMTNALARIAATAGAIISLVGLVLFGCVPAQQYNALENDYNQLSQQLSGEIAAQ